MRGTLSIPLQPHNQVGLIPTYAGNTVMEYVTENPQWAHPHVCGEHFACDGLYALGEGSSPRMRGTHAEHALGDVHGGLIPTYAGNTFLVSFG